MIPPTHEEIWLLPGAIDNRSFEWCLALYGLLSAGVGWMGRWLWERVRR